MANKINHRLPFAYYLKPNGVIAIDEEKAAKVRKIFRTYLETKEIRATARHLNLAASTVSYILKNNFYCNPLGPIISKRIFNKAKKILSSSKSISTGNRYPEIVKQTVIEQIKKSGGKILWETRFSGLPKKYAQFNGIMYSTVRRWMKRAEKQG